MMLAWHSAACNCLDETGKIRQKGSEDFIPNYLVMPSIQTALKLIPSMIKQPTSTLVIRTINVLASLKRLFASRNTNGLTMQKSSHIKSGFGCKGFMIMCFFSLYKEGLSGEKLSRLTVILFSSWLTYMKNKETFLVKNEI